MRADQLNRASTAALIALSLTALITVLTGVYAVLFGGRQPFREADEGTAARFFQLSVAALLPVGLLFLTTANWARPLRTARPLALSTLLLAIAFGLLLYFERS